MLEFDSNLLTSIAHLIQLSVAPVFLLGAVGALLNVFTGRLARIIDRLEELDQYENDNNKENISFKDTKHRRDFLTIRLKSTNLTIIFCTITGLLISLVIVTMFLSALFKFVSSIFISVLFILALLCLSISLMLFLREILITTNYARFNKDNIPQNF